MGILTQKKIQSWQKGKITNLPAIVLSVAGLEISVLTSDGMRGTLVYNYLYNLATTRRPSMRKPLGVTLKPLKQVDFNGPVRPKTFYRVEVYDELLKTTVTQHVRLIPFLLRIRLRLSIGACYRICRKMRKLSERLPITFE